MPAPNTPLPVNLANKREQCADPHHFDHPNVEIKYNKINFLSKRRGANGSENPDFQLPAAYQPAPENLPASAHSAPMNLPGTYQPPTTQLPRASQ